jgi:NADPH:quinone reductase-like Zn-dependent oxidoreductase
MKKMKAVVCTGYGPPKVLRITDAKKPAPKKDEVCIKIYATAVTATDIFVRGFQWPIKYVIPMRLIIGLTKPRNPIIGFGLAGEIETLGENVKRFKKGDQVYGLTGFRGNAYAEYKCMPVKDSMMNGCLALKPENLTYEEAAAAAYGGLIALQFLGKGNIQTKQKVLIYGASGSVGTTAVQIAGHDGAGVTGVCSGANSELVNSLGADRVLDYTKRDSLDLEDQYDLILDAVGKGKTSVLKKACRKALSPGGKYVSVEDGFLKLQSKRLDTLKEVIEAGYFKPVIDRVYPLEEIVEAHKYAGKGHKKGGVVISVQPSHPHP